MKSNFKYLFKALPKGYYRKLRLRCFQTSNEGAMKSNRLIKLYLIDTGFAVDRLCLGFGVLLLWFGATLTADIICREKEAYYHALHQRYS